MFLSVTSIIIGLWSDDYVIKFSAIFSWKTLPQFLQHRNLSNLSSIKEGPYLLFDQVKGYHLQPMSVNPQSWTASLNSLTMLRHLVLLSVFSFSCKISLKSPKHNQGKEDKAANLLIKVQVWCFCPVSGCPYSCTPPVTCTISMNYSIYVMLTIRFNIHGCIIMPNHTLCHFYQLQNNFQTLTQYLFASLVQPPSLFHIGTGFEACAFGEFFFLLRGAFDHSPIPKRFRWWFSWLLRGLIFSLCRYFCHHWCFDFQTSITLNFPPLLVFSL